MERIREQAAEKRISKMSEKQTIPNTLSQTLTSTEYMAKYDASAKDLLVERIILAVILKFCVEEYADCELEEIAGLIEGEPEIGVTPVIRELPPKITGSDTVDKTQEEGTYYFDIKFDAALPKKKAEEIKKQIGITAEINEDANRDTSYIQAEPMEWNNSKNQNESTEPEDSVDTEIGEQIHRKHRVNRMIRHALGIIVNIEPHGRFAPGYPVAARMNFHLARMLSREYGTVFTDEQFEKLKKCYSIWILTDAPKYCANTVSIYETTERHIIGVGENEKIKDYALNPDTYQLMTGVMIRLGDVKETNSELLRIVGAILSNQISAEEKKDILREYKIPLTEEIERKVDSMGSLADAIEERAREEGRKEGKEEGRKEGKAEGRKEGKEEGRKEGKAEQEQIDISRSIHNLMDTLKLTAEQAMKALKVSMDSSGKYISMT